jgi:hypothetical protein
MKISILMFLLLIFWVPSAFGGWSEDMRLTYRHFEIEPQVIARNDTVHVVWNEVAGPMRISYLRSTDAGLDWGNIIDLTEPGHLGTMPNLSLAIDKVFVGWGDEDTNLVNWVSNVGYSISIAGESWPPPSYIFHRWTIRGYGKISTTMSSDSIYLAFLPWISDSAGNQLIFFKYSSDIGSTWSDSVVIGRTPQYLNGLSMKKCGHSIYVVWSGLPYPDGQMFEVIVTASQDGGLTWLEPFQLSSEDLWAAQHSCIACDDFNGNAAIGWVDSRESHGFPGDLYLRMTSDGGSTWGEELHATSHHKVASSRLDIRGDSIWAVWSDWDVGRYGYSNTEIAFTKSTDRGQNWAPYERLTYAEGYSQAPWISYDLGKLHLVWEESRRPPDSTRDEIYYKRYDAEPDSIRQDDTGNIPKGINLSAYPNPFNSSVMITYSTLNKGGTIAIYDIQGQQVRTFNLTGKEGKIIWDACDAQGNKVCSGLYFAKATNNINSSYIKLIYLK